MNINIFKKKKEIETGTISLTFKMSLINFISYFKSHHNWEVQFEDNELDRIAEAIKKARKGKSQDLVFKDDYKIKNIVKRR